MHVNHFSPRDSRNSYFLVTVDFLIKLLLTSSFVIMLMPSISLLLFTHESFDMNSTGTYVLGANEKHLSERVSSDISICTVPESKSFVYMWSTSYLRIRTTKHCTIYEGINIKDIENSKKKFSVFVNELMLKTWNRFLNSEERCDLKIYVKSIFKPYCLNVETDSVITVDYVFSYVDYKMVILSLFGVLLFWNSSYMSRNAAFYYLSGIVIGIIGSGLILIIISTRIIPKKLATFFAFVTSSSLILFLRSFDNNFRELADRFQNYVAIYVTFSGTVAFIYCYYKGAIVNQRSLNILNILLKAISCVLMFLGTSFIEASILFLLEYLILYSLKNIEICNRIRSKYTFEKRQLLTLEEYDKQRKDYTQQALDDLKEFCLEFPSWDFFTDLKQPVRFARFVRNQINHISEHEVQEYKESMQYGFSIPEDDETLSNETIF